MSSGKIRVYITIDTETSMGGAWRNPAYRPLPLEQPVFGKCGSRFYGLPLIMSILEEHGFRGTFFTEVFCTYNVGDEAVDAVFRLIRERGHDAQLHLHPEQRFYRDFQQGGPRLAEGRMHVFPEERQTELIREGMDLFRRFTGKAPRAYRAGCYAASEITLRAVAANGIEIDSSYNLAYLESTCGFQSKGLNAPAVLEGVHEFPVSVFRIPGVTGYKPLEISAVSVTEILTTIDRLQRAGCQDVVLVLHSFSLLKNLGVRFEQCRPDRLVIRRFRKLCAALHRRRDQIVVSVLGEAITSALPQPQVIPSVGWLQPSVRKLCQAVNRLQWV